MGFFGVIGLGRFGGSVARTLTEKGHEVLGVDSDQELVDSLSDMLTYAVQADATDEGALGSLGLANCDAVVVSIGQDIESSILATLIVKGLGVPYVVAKAQSDLHGQVLDRVGADRVVYPERDMGVRLAHSLLHSNIVDYIELAPGYNIVEVVAAPEVIGRTLGELDLRARYGINVVAIRRGDDVNVAPGASDSIEEGDLLVMMGRESSLSRLEG